MKINRSVMRWGFIGIFLLALSAASFGQVAVGISVRFGPPAIPVYAQPICPGPGYMWTPGYWAWSDDDGYYWVPGTWVMAPVGMYWTPGWWGWNNGFYLWHAGYWGPHVGFYGGINYGYGYTGMGFYGGEWRGRNFYYNRSITNVSVTNVTNVYNRTVIVNENRVAYNGGEGGIRMHPSPEQERWARERHTPELAAQRDHDRMARGNRENWASQNHGRPMIAATARPGDFSRRSIVAARNAGGEYHPPAMSPREARGPAPGNRGNTNRGNDGFRPFTPPSRNGAMNNPRNDNWGGRNNNERGFNRPQPNNNRPNEMRPNQNRQDEFRPNQPRPNDSRPNEVRPNNNPRSNEMRPNNPRQDQMRPNENRPNENRPNQGRSNESRPQNNFRDNAPRENNHPAPAPRHENSPPRQEHPGRDR